MKTQLQITPRKSTEQHCFCVIRPAAEEDDNLGTQSTDNVQSFLIFNTPLSTENKSHNGS